MREARGCKIFLDLEKFHGPTKNFGTPMKHGCFHPACLPYTKETACERKSLAFGLEPTNREDAWGRGRWDGPFGTLLVKQQKRDVSVLSNQCHQSRNNLGIQVVSISGSPQTYGIESICNSE